jgi:hypothetical protein
MSSTLKISDTINFCQPFIGFMPLSLGTNLQPALGMANSVAQVILAPPFRWNWNRSSADFVTSTAVQTYRPAGSWVSANSYAAGTVIIDSNGNGEKVITAGTSGGSTPAWATGMFATTTDGVGSTAATWQNIGPLASIPQVSNFGYVDKAQIQDVNNGSIWKELTPKLDLSRDSAISCPKFVAAQSDDNAGDITFRLMPVPGAAYPISVNYQQAVTPFTSLNSTWAPIPDKLFYTYSYGFLALAYLYAEDVRFAAANQQFIARLLAHAEGLTQTEVQIFLNTWNSILGNVPAHMQNLQQGIQARGIGG